MGTINRAMLLLAGLITGLSFSTAFAQTSDAALEEIIVTSERREASLQEVPIAVSALGMGEIEQLQVNAAQDLQRYVPSLNMFNNITHPSNLSLSMRGGLQQDASLVVAESPIGIYVDDIYVGRLNGNNVTMSDLERVEVLRGPQGTLYGRNTGYGAIRFISRTPGEEFWGNASVGAGNDDQLVFRGSIGGPFNDSWAGSLSGEYREKDGQYFNVHPSANTETGLEENTVLRGKLHYMGSDRFDAVLSVTYSDATNDSNQLVNATTPLVPDTCAGFPSGSCGPGQSAQFSQSDLVFTHGPRSTNTVWADRGPPPLTFKPEANTEQTIVGLTLSYDITDTLTIKSITGYVGLEGNFFTDFGNTLGAGGGSETDSDQYSQEFQLLGTAFDDRLNYVAGLYWLNDESEQLWGWNLLTVNFPPFPPGGAPLSTYTIDVETDNISVFGEASYNITDALKVTAGIRYTEDDKDLDFLFNPLFPAPGAPVPITLNVNPDDWTPKLGIDYVFETDGVLNSGLLYASYAEGFKGAGFSAIAISSADSVGTYDAENNETYEVGFKGEWFNNRLRTNLAYYFSDITDIVMNSTLVLPDGNLAFPVDNQGDAEIQGLEFEITAVPIDGLNLFFSGTAFTDGEYTRVVPGSASDDVRRDFEVEPQTPQTADYSFNIGFDYTFEMPGNLIRAVTFGSDYYEMDDYFTAATNDFHNEGWDIWNAFISADIGENWQLKLTGKNLSDDDIITSGSRGLGAFVVTYPREYLLEATYRY
jgi:iron complex outermembrane receptor protein